MTSDNTYEIAVVTKVPTEPDEASGNLALAFDLYWETDERDEKTYLSKTLPLVDGLTETFGNPQVAAGILFKLRAPVFKLGEILFLDDSGREITPAMGGRKPSKWLIETTTVDTLDEAIALSREVTETEYEAEQNALASIRDAFTEEA